MLEKIKKLLGDESESLLNYKCVFSKVQLCIPGPDFIDRVFSHSDRPITVLRNLQYILVQ